MDKIILYKLYDHLYETRWHQKRLLKYPSYYGYIQIGTNQICGRKRKK